MYAVKLMYRSHCQSALYIIVLSVLLKVYVSRQAISSVWQCQQPVDLYERFVMCSDMQMGKICQRYCQRSVRSWV